MKRLLAMLFLFAANASAQITLEIKDYAALPITGLVDGKTNYDALLARVSGLREEPGGANRFIAYHSRRWKRSRPAGPGDDFGLRARRCPPRHGCRGRVVSLHKKRWDDPRHYRRDGEVTIK